MSKLKLLLLGIFTIIGIFNFTSAKEFSFNCPNAYSNCEPYPVYTFDSLYDNICLTNNSNNLNVKVLTEFDERSTYLYSEIGENGCINRTIKAIGFYLDNENVGNYTVGINGGDIIESGGGNEGGNEGGQIIPGGFDNFTPAVDGLHITVNQIIPLMVFIGIGVLVVTLGFIVIRWLVNWLGGKIISVFKSKRG